MVGFKMSHASLWTVDRQPVWGYLTGKQVFSAGIAQSIGIALRLFSPQREFRWPLLGNAQPSADARRQVIQPVSVNV